MASNEVKPVNTVDQIIAQEHRSINNAFEYYKAASDPKDKKAWFNELVRLYSIHSTALEIAFFNTVEKKMGKVYSDRIRKEHLQVKQSMKDLEGMKFGEPAFDQKLHDVMAEFLRQAKFAETDYIPQLLSRMNPEEISHSTDKYTSAQSIAPTHPHPSAPNHGGMSQKIVSALTVPIDKMRDSRKTFPSQEESLNSQRQALAETDQPITSDTLSQDRPVLFQDSQVDSKSDVSGSFKSNDYTTDKNKSDVSESVKPTDSTWTNKNQSVVSESVQSNDNSTWTDKNKPLVSGSSFQSNDNSTWTDKNKPVSTSSLQSNDDSTLNDKEVPIAAIVETTIITAKPVRNTDQSSFGQDKPVSSDSFRNTTGQTFTGQDSSFASEPLRNTDQSYTGQDTSLSSQYQPLRNDQSFSSQNKSFSSDSFRNTTDQTVTGQDSSLASEPLRNTDRSYLGQDKSLTSESLGSKDQTWAGQDKPLSSESFSSQYQPLPSKDVQQQSLHKDQLAYAEQPLVEQPVGFIQQANLPVKKQNDNQSSNKQQPLSPQPIHPDALSAQQRAYPYNGEH